MGKLATLAVAAGTLALTFVTLSPNAAEAGWRRGYWGWGWGPGVSVYVGPGCCWYGPRYGYAYPYGYPYAYYPYWRKRYWRRHW